jgi:hypothetical protein
MCENSENLPATKQPKREDNARTPEFSVQQVDTSADDPKLTSDSPAVIYVPVSRRRCMIIAKIVMQHIMCTFTTYYQKPTSYIPKYTILILRLSTTFCIITIFFQDSDIFFLLIELWAA